ncbi:MAG: hypothetical protein FWC47_06970 [Oscillospiraceae bacterium]|nr:hypothetical protein [Oscillospiraceae bacterium]
MQLLSQEFKEYNKYLSKLGVYGSMLDELNNGNYIITMTTNHYYLEHRKSFSKKPQRNETKIITPRNYACYITSIPFFKDRIKNSYTTAGYLPTSLICYSPDRTYKVERIFKIEYKTEPINQK